MDDPLLVFGLIANIITVLAGLIAIAGVIWAFLGRARLSIYPLALHPAVAPDLTMIISSVGSNPVRSIELSAGLLDDNGFSASGGGIGERAALNRGETLTVMGYEVGKTSFGSEPRDGEIRFEVQPAGGWYVTVQWQSTFFPWRRSSRTYAWSPARRFACEMPEELVGKKEIRFLERTRNPSLNPSLPDFAAPLNKRVRAAVATDATFDGIVASAARPVIVGFGPTWQGEWWEDVKRMLDLLADRHTALVTVVVVNTDESPALAERFATNEVPVFKVLLSGEIAKSYVGPHSLPDLEREFADFIQRPRRAR